MDSSVSFEVSGAGRFETNLFWLWLWLWPLPDALMRCLEELVWCFLGASVTEEVGVKIFLLRERGRAELR